MRTIFFGCLALACLGSGVAEAASPAGLKVCLKKSTGAITARGTCRKGEIALNLANLTDRVTARQGGPANGFKVVAGEGAAVDGEIPAATTIPAFPPIINPGSLQREAACSEGKIVSSSCESSVTAGISVFTETDAEGESATCTWSNSSASPVPGRFFVRLVCADFD